MFAMYGGKLEEPRPGRVRCSTRTRCWSRSTKPTAAHSNRTPGSSSPPTWGRSAGSAWTSPPRRSTGTRSRELVDASYRLVAPKKLIKQLDERLTRATVGMVRSRHHEFREPLPRGPDSHHQRLRLPVRRPRPTTRRRPGRPGRREVRQPRPPTARWSPASTRSPARSPQRGIGVGDVVGLLAPNSSAFAVAFHGILRAGATATTINALFTAKDIAKQLTDSKATMLVTVTPLLPQAAEAAAAVGLADED